MNLNNCLVIPHGGLGDHIINCAIYRSLAARYGLLCIPVKYRNCTSVEYMLRDLNNVVIRPVEDDEDMLYFRDTVWKGAVVNTGCFHPISFDGGCWDVEFYRHAGVEFSDRWARWHCPRDEQAEERVYAQYGEFRRGAYTYMIFKHDDPNRGMTIRPTTPIDVYNENPVRTITPDPSITPILFHWRKVIEACDELHCIPSSFAAFIDSIDLPKKPKLYLHSYTRANEPLMQVQKNWEILK